MSSKVKTTTVSGSALVSPPVGWRFSDVLIVGLFVASGFTALIYEVVWTKLLMLTFGVSTYAVAAVLMAFMGGLALGAFIFGRIIDRRKDHLRLYAIIELCIGLYACLLPILLDYSGDLYVLIYRWLSPGLTTITLIRLALSILLLLIPTALMGGTLPILSSLLTRSPGAVGRRVAVLYGLNTLGGAIGCLSAGFIFIPTWGLQVTTWTATAINVAIFLAALWAYGRGFGQASLPAGVAGPSPARGNRAQAAKSRTVEAGPASCPRHMALAVIVAIGLSGASAMIFQTLWTRILSMIVGTTVYAFSAIVGAFLLGLVAGSLLHAWLRIRRPFAVLAAIQAVIGGYVLLLMPQVDELPFAFLWIFDLSRHSWPLFQVGRFAMLLLIMLIPTTLFGMSFPLAVQVVSGSDGRVGKVVGTVCGVNTLGAILGSFVGGFVLIPLGGLQMSMAMVAAGNLLLGASLAAINEGGTPRARIVQAAGTMGVLVLGMMLLRPWNLNYFNSGAYVYAHDYNRLKSADDLRAAMNAFQVRYYREGPMATVSVLSMPNGTMSLSIDGKTDASTGKNADMSTQILLSHLPALFVDKPDDALMIGLGSGVSLGSLLKYRVKSVDVLEISEAVVEASDYFREYNYAALEDPRVNMIVGDGRHHLRRTDREYDLIISQPSNPWIAGVADLFTKEYYRLMAQRTKRGGVVCQWIPSYHMSREMLAVVCKTFSREFPHTSLWTSSVVGDLFLIGSKEPLGMNYELFLERLARPGIKEDLGRIGLENPRMLAMTFKFDNAGIQRFVGSFGPDLPENTDMFPVLEYMTPRFLLTQRVAKDFSTRSDLTGDLSQLVGLMRFAGDKAGEIPAGFLTVGDNAGGS